MKKADIRVEGFPVGPLETNCYLVWDPSSMQGVVVDPGLQSDAVLQEAARLDVALTAILCTHGHFDHTHRAAYFKGLLRCPLLIHEADAHALKEMPEHAALFGFSADPGPEPDAFLADGGSVPVGSASLAVLHTPGHTRGSVCFAAEGILLSGDTLFAQSVGRTDLPGGSYEELMASIRDKILRLPDATQVYPGHGPATSIAHERRHNPFLRGLGP